MEAHRKRPERRERLRLVRSGIWEMKRVLTSKREISHTGVGANKKGLRAAISAHEALTPKIPVVRRVGGEYSIRYIQSQFPSALG